MIPNGSGAAPTLVFMTQSLRGSLAAVSRLPVVGTNCRPQTWLATAVIWDEPRMESMVIGRNESWSVLGALRRRWMTSTPQQPSFPEPLQVFDLQQALVGGGIGGRRVHRFFDKLVVVHAVLGGNGELLEKVVL